jgi:bifunctional non-homologous end joining protein LigD
MGLSEPSHPTDRNEPPTGGIWLHEIKSDGYRAQVHVRDGKATVYTRNGWDWTDRFQTIARAAERLQVREAVIDGEAVVQDSRGVADFESLRRELRKGSSRLTYLAFDLLYFDGLDLRRTPLLERKRVLERVLADAPGALLYCEHLEGDGRQVWRHACAMHLEGIVSKRRNSAYGSGRTDNWLKIKCTKSDTFPIVAFVEKLGARPRKVASLYIGRHDGNQLLYAGKVRTGYTEVAARELREKLDPYIIKKSPLSKPVKKPKATWVYPIVDAEVSYSSVTEDGLLREAVFKGIRDDLQQPPVKSARPATAKPHVGVPRANILQLLPDAVVPSKDQLADYWHRVAKRALPYLARRPLKLVRHTHATTFYHKGPLPPVPDTVHQLKITKREGGEGVRLWIDDQEGLLGLVDLGAVELHPWAASVDDIEHADTMIFDLDPGEGVQWEFVIETALMLRELLQAEGFDPWPKLTGGKGVHLMAPLQEKLTHDATHAYAKRLAQKLAATAPDRYVTSATLAKRSGRLFIDYLRNGRGTTAIGTYSPRARPGFPIAAPVTWRQVENGIPPDAFTIASPLRRQDR